MTERGRAQVQRSAHAFAIGPSRLHWDGASLRIDFDEIGLPLLQRVRGRVRIWPKALSTHVTALDDLGRHRWGPIAPCARIEVDIDRPAARWQGDAYLDANEGDEPIDRPFTDWDWSRSTLADGRTAVIYDVRQKSGLDRVVTRCFHPNGHHEAFEPPPRQPLPRTGWRIERQMRSDPAHAARIEQTLEDTPFYTRSVLSSGLFGERVTSVHETLSLPRLVAPSTRLMLPWRMPRRA